MIYKALCVATAAACAVHLQTLQTVQADDVFRPVFKADFEDLDDSAGSSNFNLTGWTILHGS